MGDPRDTARRVDVPGTTQEKISAAENASASPEALAVQLLVALFSEEELSKGNCTKPRKSGVILLDQVRLKAIRG